MIRKYRNFTPVVPESAYIDDSSVLIGDVTLGERVTVWCNATLRGDFGSIAIEEGSNVQDNAVFHTDLNTEIHIGKNVSIGHGAIVHGATVGDGSLIGMGAILLDGAVIGKNCIIGAGALVAGNKVIPDGSLVVGVPGKIVRETTPEEIAANLHNAGDYEERRVLYKAQEK